ncbi:MAG: copper homeostasis protein CutC [Spiroplasma sp.]
MKLEVIAKNLKDVIKINKTQANRIEFCRKLEVGGLTPRCWIIRLAARISNLPINVMLRPSSKSFNYSEKDFAKMLKVAEFLEKTKVNGIVFGILDKNNEIDVQRMKQVIAKIPSKEKIFHKAFDKVNNFEYALDVLAKLKMDAVLTAAGENNINQNLATLKKLTAMKKLTIIGGGGITFDNIKKISCVVNDVHVGRTVRKNNSWKSDIDLVKINQLSDLIKNS